MLLLPLTGKLLCYYITCYIVYGMFLVLFLYIYVSIADPDKPILNVLAEQPFLQTPGLS